MDLASQGTVADAICEEARAHFDEREFVELTLAIIAINGWNQLNVAVRTSISA